MTDRRLERLRRMNEAATPAPWGAEDMFVVGRRARENAVLVAALRNAAPAVIDLLELVLDESEHQEWQGGVCLCERPWPCPEREAALVVLAQAGLSYG
jgi:hypothetical protein